MPFSCAGNYETRITQDRSDELGDLIAHHNVLAQTLERTSKAEREWISNTSHELQTPLAVLRAQIEALPTLCATISLPMGWRSTCGANGTWHGL